MSDLSLKQFEEYFKLIHEKMFKDNIQIYKIDIGKDVYLQFNKYSQYYVKSEMWSENKKIPYVVCPMREESHIRYNELKSRGLLDNLMFQWEEWLLTNV
jgi:hypothetical protein